jgi:hypothetical protein
MDLNLKRSNLGKLLLLPNNAQFMVSVISDLTVSILPLQKKNLSLISVY